MTLFVSIQHLSDDTDVWPAFGRLSTIGDPATRLPDFQDGMPLRASFVAITREDGGLIGS